MEEEKKTTEKGVENVRQMTEFHAQTVNMLKEAAAGNASVGAPPQFDGKFVMDQCTFRQEEDPKFVKSNYVLVNLLDQFERQQENPSHSLVQFEEEVKLSTGSNLIPPIPIPNVPPQTNAATTPNPAASQVDLMHSAVVGKSAQLMKTLGSSNKKNATKTEPGSKYATPAREAEAAQATKSPLKKDKPEKGSVGPTPSTAQRTAAGGKNAPESLLTVIF